MIEDKIIELYNYGFSIDYIVEHIYNLYNKNYFHIFNFNKKSIPDIKVLVYNTILKYLQ